MTLPEVIRLIEEHEAEAEKVEAHNAVTWLREVRKAITDEWDRELLQEAEAIEVLMPYYCECGTVNRPGEARCPRCKEHAIKAMGKNHVD